MSTIQLDEWEELETLGTCRIPPIATEFEDLGFALEDWLAKKRQYSEFSSRDGTIEDDKWMASMYEFLHQSRKETVVFKGDEDTFQSLFDKFVSSASAKHIFEIGQRISSLWYEEGEKKTRMPWRSKGDKSKSGMGKHVMCWVCGNTCHMSQDCFHNKGSSKGKGKVQQSFERWQRWSLLWRWHHQQR